MGHTTSSLSTSDSLNYNLQLSRPKFPIEKSQLKVVLCLLDENHTRLECVRNGEHFQPVPNVQLWWPRGMGKQALYTLEVGFLGRKNPLPLLYKIFFLIPQLFQVSVYLDAQLVDLYRETFGFRWVELKNGQIHINDKPFYCQGFGMHEDFYVSRC